MNLRVGDNVKVVCLVPAYGWGYVRRGDEGVVVSVNNDEVWVNFKGQSYWHGEESEFELVDFSLENE